MPSGRALRWAALLFVTAPPAYAQQQPEQEQGDEQDQATVLDAWRPPTLTITRYHEDWSHLADPANRTGHWTERFKYIPLDATGAVYLTTGIELRLRNENYTGLDWTKSPDSDQGFVWFRAMPYADLHAGHFRAFVQPIASYATGVRPAASPVDRTRIDLLQAFADYVVDLDPATRLRIVGGRQLVSLGSERLVGTRYGPNTPLAFDGGRLLLDRGAMTASVFYLAPVIAGPVSFDDRRSRSKALWGLYTTRWLGPAHHARIDLYYLGFRDDQAVFQQGQGREIRHTLGLRGAGRTPKLHWDVEAMAQFGRFADAPIRAWSVSLNVGRGLPDLPLKPDLTVHFDIVSGDRDPKVSSLQTFNPLFPKGNYFGELSPIGPRNIIDLHPTLTLDPGGNVALGLSAMAYWRQSRGDGVYDIPGRLLRRGSPAEARFIGKQAEAKLAWQATPELNLSSSVSRFFPGAFLRDSGSHRGITMTAVEANFRF